MDVQDRAQKRYHNLLALRGEEMPASVDAGGRRWLRRKTFKHDFFAATGLYAAADNGDLSVLKIFRPYSYKGLPYGWLSRWEARHEETVYRILQDTGRVPKWIGRVGSTGIMHAYLPGNDLLYGVTVEEAFFDEVEALLRTMHTRGIAYVDTNKPDNILAGDDGHPYLIDFQITWVQPWFPLSLLTWPLFAIFRDADLYHLMKHRRKFFPDKISKDDLERRRPWYVRLHRIFANPVRRHRRNYLRSVESAAENHPEGAARH
jgi:serine/threonine protein kinase